MYQSFKKWNDPLQKIVLIIVDAQHQPQFPISLLYNHFFLDKPYRDVVSGTHYKNRASVSLIFTETPPLFISTQNASYVCLDYFSPLFHPPSPLSSSSLYIPAPHLSDLLKNNLKLYPTQGLTQALSLLETMITGQKTLFLVGEKGLGKTEIIMRWANLRHKHLQKYQVSQSSTFQNFISSINWEIDHSLILIDESNCNELFLYSLTTLMQNPPFLKYLLDDIKLPKNIIFAFTGNLPKENEYLGRFFFPRDIPKRKNFVFFPNMKEAELNGLYYFLKKTIPYHTLSIHQST